MLSKLGRFVISGGIGAGVNIGILFLLTHVFDVWYLFSSILAFILAVFVSFICQKFWTFKNTATTQIHYQLVWYFGIAGINLIFNTLIMYLCVDGLGLHYIVGQVIASLLIAIWSYLIYEKLFRGIPVADTVSIHK